MDIDQRLLKQLPVETRSLARACVKNKPAPIKKRVLQQPKTNNLIHKTEEPSPKTNDPGRAEFVQKVGQKIAMINQKIDNEVRVLSKTIEKMETDAMERRAWITDGNYHGRPKFTTTYNPKETARIQAFQIKREEKINKLLTTSKQNEESIQSMKIRLGQKAKPKQNKKCIFKKGDLSPHVRQQINIMYEEGLAKIKTESRKMIDDYEIDLNTDPNYQDLDGEDLAFIYQEFQCRLTKMETRLMRDISSKIDHYIAKNLPTHHIESQKAVRISACNYLFDNGREIEFDTEELAMISRVKDHNSRLYVTFVKGLEAEAEIMRSSFEARVDEFLQAGNNLGEINQARMSNEETIKIYQRLTIRKFSAEAAARTKVAENAAIEHMYDRLSESEAFPEIEDLVLQARKAFAQINAELYPSQANAELNHSEYDGLSARMWADFKSETLKLVEDVVRMELDWSFFVDSLREKWREVRRIEASYIISDVLYLESMDKCLKIVRSCAIIYQAKHEKKEEISSSELIQRIQPVEVKMDPRIFKLREQCKKLLEEIGELDVQIVELRRQKSVEVIRPLEYIPMEPVSPQLQKKIEEARKKYRKPLITSPAAVSVVTIPARRPLTSYSKYYQEDVEYQKRHDQALLLGDLRNCPSLYN